MISVQQTIIDRLTALSEADPEGFKALLYNMRNDSKLFAEMICSDILTENLTDQQKRQYLEGTLDREVYMPQYMQRMYDAYDDMFMGRKFNSAFILYRGAAKSTIKVIATVKAICFALEPGILFISESQRQACLDNERVMDIMTTNPVLLSIFGNMKGPIWNKEMSTYNNNGNIIALHATGMGSRIRGHHYLGQRPSFVICDDFESEGNSLTKEMRSKVLNTINSKILKLGDYIYKLVFQGTIIHPECFLPKIMTGEITRFSGMKGTIIVQAISNSPSIKYNDVKKRWQAEPAEIFKIGDPAWPSRYPYTYINDEIQYHKEINGGANFWEVLQEWYNIPRHDSAPVFKTEMITKLENAELKRFENMHYIEITELGKITKIPVRLYEGYDPAISRNKAADSSVDYILATMPDNRKVIVEIYRDKIGPEEQIQRILETNRKYYIQEAMIETFGYQLALKEMVEKRARDNKLRLFASEYKDNSRSKGGKYKLGLANAVNTGEICYLPCVKNIEEHKTELANFSVESIHDDTIDGLFLAYCAAEKYAPPANMDVDKYIAEKKKLNNRAYSGKPKRSIMAL